MDLHPKEFLFGLFVLVLFSLASEAKELEFNLNKITIENGLKHPHVYNFYQDSLGFMWFATNYGLVRYDGYEFRTFTPPTKDSMNCSDWIWGMCSDYHNGIWIGTFGSGSFYHFDMGAEKFTQYLGYKQFDQSYIHAVLDDKRGNVWLGTDRGLLRFDKESKSIVQYKTGKGGGNLAWTILKEKAGNLWLGTWGGLDYFDVEKEKIIDFRFYPHNPAPRIDRRVYSLLQDRNGEIWVGTISGLSRFDTLNNRYQNYLPQPKSIYEQNVNNLISCIVERRSGEIWLGTYGSGLYKFNKEDHNFISVKYEPNRTGGLLSPWISALFEDRDENLWIATSAGINVIAKNKNQNVLRRHNMLEANSVTSGEIRAVAEDSRGNLWIGTYGGGLSKWDRERDVYTTYRRANKNKHYLSNVFIDYIYEDRNKRIWVCTNTGLNLYDPERDTFIYYALPGMDASGSLRTVVRITEDHQGRIWLGTRIGLSLFDPQKGVVEYYLLPFSNLRPVCEIADNILLVGSQNGLDIFDIRLKQWRHINAPDKTNRGYKENRIFQILRTSKGKILVAANWGLGQFSLSSKSFDLVAVEPEITQEIYALAEDDDGNLWIRSKQGLYYYNAQKHVLKFFDVDANIPYVGVTYYVFGYAGMCKTADNNIVVGGANGFTMLNSNEIIKNQKRPPIVLTELRINNRPQHIYPVMNHSALPSLNYYGSIKLHHKQNTLSIKFSALDYTNTKKNRYAYILEGFNEDWVYIGNQREATFTNLDPGVYTFRANGSNNDGVWNEQGASLKIIILPPWYATWWFRSILFLLFVVLVLTAHRLRVRHLRRDRQRQREFSRQLIQSQEAERKRIASGLHDSLGQNLLIVHNEIQLLAAEHSDLKREITPLVTDIKESINEVREISYNLHPHLLDRLGLNKALESVINKVDKSSGIRIEYKLNEVEKFLDKEKQIHFYRIIQEALNNIVKHARATEVKILIVKQRKNIVATISDNGRGFNVRAVMSRSNAKVGFGLANMRERARLIGGNFSVSSGLNKGTEIKMSILLKKVS